MLTVAAWLVPTVLLVGLYLLRSLREEKRSLELRRAVVESGLTEPASLHPVIDAEKCFGCGNCIDACPEGKILGMVDGRAQLLEPTSCIGHGACAASCPTEAIQLVFGTEKRGVDIPVVSPTFETNVRGLFIAGELGGMGLIRNAIEQGRQAIDSIRKLDGIGKGDRLDVVIVGAGPAGFSASLAALEHGLRFATLEQETLGGTVAHYPRGKIVMTAPARLPIVGQVRFRETTKEALLDFWSGVEQKTGLAIRYSERVEKVAREDAGFRVTTTRTTYATRAVLLTIGRRGTPRKLGVPGEEHEKVVYRLIDPEQYRGRKVLVVGGGDSALEAATSIAEQPGATVAISYRSEAFGRAKPKNRQKLEQAAGAGRLLVLLKSDVRSIAPGRVVLEHEGRRLELPNDVVIVCAGGILPMGFLKEIGVEVQTKYGSA